ncbi:MAG: outer membrane protein transport protein [Armatimonadetes bacterium]|nr:outer membrane protein transport protein [Armatimonadota bacterium]
MAGVGIATGLDAMAASLNPAGMARLTRRLDLGVNIFMPIRSYKVSGAPTGMGSFLEGTVKSTKELFFCPCFGMVWPQKDGANIGLTLYGNGGMNTTWPASANGGAGVFGSGKAGVNLEQMFVSGSYSKPINDNLSIGAALIFARQTFSATGLQAFNPTATDLTNNGQDESTGIGLKLGVIQNLTPNFRVGATWEPKIRMSRFDQYAGLFAQHGKFDIPENFGIGFAFEPITGSLIEFDIRTIKYGGVPAVANPMANIANGLGSDNGPGFGWRDVTTYKLGVQRKVSETTTVRAGISYGRQPIPSSEMMFNILAPGVQEWHLTAGLSKVVGKGEWSTAIVYSPQKTVSGPNPNDPTQTISLKMHQFELQIGYTIRF